MSTLQQQIQQLALQLEQLAAQVEEPVKHSSMDFEHLVLETSLQPFKYHPVKKHDEYVKALYLQTLLSVITYVEQEKEERYRLVAKIFNGLDMAESFEAYVQKSNMITPEQFSRFSQMINETNFAAAFLVDALTVLGIHQEKKGLLYVAEIASSLGIEEDKFKLICQLAAAILQVNHNSIEAVMNRVPYFCIATAHYLHTIQSVYGPVLRIVGTGAEVVPIKQFYEKSDVYLENVKIIIEQELLLKGIERLYIKNCEIIGGDVLTLEDINLVHIENTIIKNLGLSNVAHDEDDSMLGIKNNKEISGRISIQHCKQVKLKDIQVKDCYIGNQDCLFSIRDVDLLECLNSRFENNKFYVVKTAEEETIIKVNNIRKLLEQQNTIKNCKVYMKSKAVSFWGAISQVSQGESDTYFENHEIKPIISKL